MTALTKAQKKRNSMTQVSFAARPKLQRILGRSLLVGFVAAVMIGITAKIEELSYESYLRDLKLEATVNLIDVREQISEGVSDYVLALTELATMVGQNPGVSEAEFSAVAAELTTDIPEVRAVAVAPDLTVEMVYPLDKNAAMMGQKDVQDELHYILTGRVLQAGEGRISGPDIESDGSRTITLKKAVFTSSPTGGSKFWGIVLLKIDHTAALQRLGIPEFEENYDLLIKDFSAADPGAERILAGDTAVVDRDPVEIAFAFPFGRWTLAATPEGGWPTHRPGYLANWIERSIMIAASLFALWYIMSLLDRRRLAEKLLSTGIEALDHGFVMFDADRRLIAFNNKYKQLAGGSGMVKIGTRYEDIVKANLAAGLIPDAVGREEEWYAEWSERFEIKAADKEQVLADGRLIRAYDRPMADGSVVGLRIDITDLKKAQIAAEAANKAKTDFMGVLSHELRTPLTVILGHAQLAKNIRNMPVFKKLKAEIESHPDSAGETLPKLEAMNDQIVKMMEALERSGNHLFTLISEILDFAKIDSGTLSMEMEDVTAASVVDSVVEQMRPMVEEKGLKLELDRVDCAIHADTKRIQQVIINLISNASKFTDEGGISVSVKQTDTAVLLSVRDTGIGIPEDQLKKVFEAFHQVDNSSGRKYGGTGLGLAISRDIALAHGGDMVATSVMGEGSTFTLTLPRPQVKSLPVKPDAEEIEALVA